MLDDAFISFRYAKNFSQGYGLVFNPGTEPVEGYTNFLWIIILAFSYKIGIDIVLLSKVLGYIFSISTILILLFYLNYKNNSLIQIVSALILSTCGAFTVWGTSGMETSMFTFLLTFILLYLGRNISNLNNKKLIILGVLTSLLTLTRPEGLIVFATNLIVILFLAYKNKKHILENTIFYILSFSIIICLHEAFRYFYYHDFLPNTFYNKVGNAVDQYVRGLRYIKLFIEATWLILIPIFIYTCFKIKNIAKNRLNIKNYLPLILSITAIMFIFYIIYVGGDVMPAFRFFTPLIPALSILTTLGLYKLTKYLKMKKSLVFIIFTLIICLFNLLQWKFNIKFNKHLKEDKVAEYGKEVGLWLKGNFDKNTKIATNTAGTIPYYSNFYTIDMLGLNDKHIAKKEMPNMGTGFPGHEKTDGAYILSQNPDIIQFGSSLGSIDPVLISDFEIDNLKEFQDKYILHEYTLPSGRKLYLYIK